ncbi:MAG: hypothetical protein U1E45_22625 [Geminicoccaceae bacterium]
MTLAVAVLLVMLSVATSVAGLTQAETASVGVAVPADARIEPDLSFRDESGVDFNFGDDVERLPTVLVLADYTCTTLCGAAASTAAAALEATGLTAARDYRAVVLGIDPKDGPAAAAAAKASELRDFPGIRDDIRFFTADQATVDRVTATLGYRYAYDEEHDQFAHPAALFILAADGSVARVLAVLTLVPSDLRLALVEAGKGHVGTLADRIRLLCYAYDPVQGLYTSTITQTLQALAALTLVGLAAFVVTLRRRAGRQG